MKNEKPKQSLQFDDQGNVVSAKAFCTVVQEKIIHISYCINQHRACPVIFASVLILFSYLQIFGQLFDKRFFERTEAQWGPFGSVGGVLDLFRISAPLLESPGSETWVLIYCSLACIGLYLAGIYFVYHSIQIQKLYFVLPVEACSVFAAVLVWILIGPICEIYVGIFYCDENQKSFLMTDTNCWSGTHIILAVVLGICMTMYIILGIGAALYFNASNPSFLSSREDGLSRLDTNTELYYCIFRILTGMLFKWLMERKLEWVFLLVHLLYSVIFAYRYYRTVPYYNPFISALYGACILGHLWQSVNSFLCNVLSKDSSVGLYKGSATVGVIGIIAAFVFAKHIRHKLISQKVIELHHAKIPSEEELDVYIQSLLQLYESQQTNTDDEMLLMGVVWRHKAECIDPECPLGKKEAVKWFYPLTEEEVQSESDNIKEKVVMLSLLNSILKERGKRAGDQASACFHLIYSNFLFRELGNAHMAIVEVMKAQKSSPTTQQRMSIYSLLRAIEEFLTLKYRKQKGSKGESNPGMEQAEYWDVTIVIRFENLLLQFIKYIEQCAGDHIEFWSHLESMIPDLNEVNKTGLRILETSKDIQRIWGKLEKINPNYPKALNIYGHYLRDISNDSEQGQELIEKAKTINLHKSVADDQVNDFELMFAEDTAIIMINGSSEQLGKIIKTNSGVTKLFGYNPFEIYGCDVSMIMPNIFAQHHSRFMQRYFETGKQFVIQTERVLYALHRNNYLICISIVVKPVPSLLAAVPQYIALIRQINKDFDYIITDQNGKIESVSVGIYHMYDIDSDSIRENPIYLQLLCPELADPVSFVEDKVKLKFCTFSGRRKLRFRIPRDYKALAHLFSQTAKDLTENTIGQPQPQVTEAKLPYNYSEAPHFFNIVYKIFKAKNPTATFDIANKNILKTCFDYTNCGIKAEATCEMIDAHYSEDTLHIKIFKVYKPKGVKKSSLDRYTNDQDQVVNNNGPKYPSHKNEPVGKLYGAKDDLVEASLMKRSHTGVRGENTVPSPLSSEGGKSDAKSPVSPRKVPVAAEIETSEAVPISIANSGARHVSFKPPDKKRTGIEVTDSGKFTFHNPSSTEQNSLTMPMGSSPQVAERTEPQRSFVIKTIDIRQKEEAKENLWHRQNTLQIQPEKDQTEGAPKDQQTPPEEGKKEDDGVENKTSAGLVSQKSQKEAVPDEPLRKDSSLKSTAKKDTGDIGSVASSTGNVMRFIRALRAALHEEYDPPAITQLRKLAQIVLATLLVLTVLCYVFSQDIFGKLRNYSDFVVKVRERSSSVLGIGESVRFLTLLNGLYGVSLNESLYDYNSSTGIGISYRYSNQTYDFAEWVPTTLEYYVNTLKEAEDFISDTLRGSSASTMERINPPAVTMINAFGTTVLSCADAINGLISHALKVKMWWTPEKLSWDRSLNDSIEYVLYNSYNSISGKLSHSLDAILDSSEDDISDNKKRFLIFLLVASGALLVSISIVLPVVVKVRKNKQELLELFFGIPARRITWQLDNCHKFCRMIHGETESERPEGEDEDLYGIGRTNTKNPKGEKVGDDTDTLLQENHEESGEGENAGGASPTGGRVQSKKKKGFRGYSANILYLLLESVVTLGILESFFMYQMIRSVRFTGVVNHLMGELGETARRMYSNELYFAICLELIATNGTSSVMDSLTEPYIDSYGATIMREQESFLQIHSDNNEYNTDAYKKTFDSMIYSDICLMIFDPVEETSIETCREYMSGILQKGLSSANVAFWDSLRDAAKDFKRTSPRSVVLQTAMVNDKRIRENHWLLFEYFSKAYGVLQTELQKAMEGIFSFEETLMLVLFLVYVAVLLVIYVVFVEVFIESTRHSLWVTKSLLTILPAELILQVPKIKKFLISTSKSVIYGIKAD